MNTPLTAQFALAPTGAAPFSRSSWGDLTPSLRSTSVWTDEMVAQAGIEVIDVPLVSIGGGIGSFVLADTLRISGVTPSQLAILTNLDVPWQTYEYLTRVSQIPRSERLRSDSSSCPDNVWAFPSYAVREAWADKSIRPLWNVLTEPIVSDYYTPRAGQVFAALEREASRIDYFSMVHRGQVSLVRRRHGGGYFSMLTSPPPTRARADARPDPAVKRVAFRSRCVHLAVGYPGLKFLPDLQEYRGEFSDRTHVVNAYESHEHVYETLRQRGGHVVVRGGGIVASRVLQRLMDDRFEHGSNTSVVQLLRTYVDAPTSDTKLARRKAKNGVAFQGFNWPKGAWGGQIRVQLERLEGEQRKALFDTIGGSHTPYRRSWQRQIAIATEQGWYTSTQGVVDRALPSGDGRVRLDIRQQTGSSGTIVADFVIDCTGLEADLTESHLYADLLQHGGAGRNPMGRLDVERSFEVRGTRTEAGGRMYASGSATLGGYYAGVDSFLGLQYAALRIADDLAEQGVIPRLGVARSVSQWWRWARHRPIES